MHAFWCHVKAFGFYLQLLGFTINLILSKGMIDSGFRKIILIASKGKRLKQGGQRKRDQWGGE